MNKSEPITVGVTGFQSSMANGLGESVQRPWSLSEVLFFPVPFLAATDIFEIYGRPFIFFYGIFLLVIFAITRKEYFRRALVHPLFLWLSIPFTLLYLFENSRSSVGIYFLQGTVSSALFILIVASSVHDRISIWRVLLSIKICGALVGLYFFYTLYFGLSGDVGTVLDALRLRTQILADQALDISPNNAGYYIGFGAIIAYYQILSRKSGFFLNLIVFLVCWFGLLTMLSRQAIISTAIGCLIVSVYLAISQRLLGRVWFLLTTIIFVSVIVAPQITWIRLDIFSNLVSYEARAQLFQIVIQQIDRLTWFGFGEGGLRGFYQTISIPYGYVYSGIPTLPHSVIVLMLAVYGVVGAVWLLIFFRIIYRITYSFSLPFSPLSKILGYAFLGQYAVFLLISHGLYLKYTGILFGLFVANEILVTKIETAEQEDDKSVQF